MRWGHPDPCAAAGRSPDGYGPDLYGDEEDRARLEAMPETMREAELYEWGEARRRSLECAWAAAAGPAEEAAPPAKAARRGEDTFRLPPSVLNAAAGKYEWAGLELKPSARLGLGVFASRALPGGLQSLWRPRQEI